MQLRLTLPADWPDDASVDVGALTLLPDDPDAWVLHALGAGARGRLRVVRDERGETASGWPLRRVEATCVDADDQPIEWRLAAVLTFLEHAATVVVRAPRAPSAARLEALDAALRAATPSWGEGVVALAELWDLEASRPRVGRAPAVDVPAGDAARADAAADRTSAEATLAAAEAAAALDPASASAWAEVGAARAAAGRHADAIAAWETAARADEASADPLYDAGLAHYLAGDFAAALDAWQRARARAPSDFDVRRKLVQALHALGRHDDAAAATADARALWAASADPAVRITDELVVDQFEVDGVAVRAFETLRPRDPRAHAVLSFRALDAAGRAAVVVRVETSDYGRERGAPYVLSVQRGEAYRAIGTSERVPPYPRLRDTARALIRDALARPPG